MSDYGKAQSKRKSRKPKYKKPYDGFPLTPRSDGRWCKRVAGTLHYFGRIQDDPDGAKALEQFNLEVAMAHDWWILGGG